MLVRLIEFAVIGIAIYCAIALVLLAWPVGRSAGYPGPAAGELDKLVVGGLLIEPTVPLFFWARDGAKRLYRLYEGAGADILILLELPGPVQSRTASTTEVPLISSTTMRGVRPRSKRSASAPRNTPQRGRTPPSLELS